MRIVDAKQSHLMERCGINLGRSRVVGRDGLYRPECYARAATSQVMAPRWHGPDCHDFDRGGTSSAELEHTMARRLATGARSASRTRPATTTALVLRFTGGRRSWPRWRPSRGSTPPSSRRWSSARSTWSSTSGRTRPRACDAWPRSWRSSDRRLRRRCAGGPTGCASSWSAPRGSQGGGSPQAPSRGLGEKLLRLGLPWPKESLGAPADGPARAGELVCAEGGGGHA